MIKKIGIDVGGVLRQKRIGRNDLKKYLDTPLLPGALEVVTWLAATFGKENIYIISKCPEEKERDIRLWLEKTSVMPQFIPNENIFFCRERVEKATIASAHGIDIFIDDRVDVLNVMKDIVKHRFLFTGGGTEEFSEDSSIICCPNWESVMAAFKAVQS